MCSTGGVPETRQKTWMEVERVWHKGIFFVILIRKLWKSFVLAKSSFIPLNVCKPTQFPYFFQNLICFIYCSIDFKTQKMSVMSL